MKVMSNSKPHGFVEYRTNGGLGEIGRAIRRTPCQINSQIEAVRDFGWQDEKSPEIRIFPIADFNGGGILYLGFELPENFYDVTKNMNETEIKSYMFSWANILLKEFGPTSVLLEEHSATHFPLELGISEQVKTDVNGIETFLIGDAMVTPHFLTGSGAVAAINSARNFAEYLKARMIQENVPQAEEVFLRKSAEIQMEILKKALVTMKHRFTTQPNEQFPELLEGRTEDVVEASSSRMPGPSGAA